MRRAWKRNGQGEFAMTQHGRFYLGKPKTRVSRRRITLAPTVVTALRRAIEGRTSEDLVFGAPRGGRLDQGNWYESRWQRAIKAAQGNGLTKTPRFHDLRHSNAAAGDPEAARPQEYSDHGRRVRRAALPDTRGCRQSH